VDEEEEDEEEDEEDLSSGGRDEEGSEGMKGTVGSRSMDVGGEEKGVWNTSSAESSSESLEIEI
jgi:hypothetical protein